MPHAQLIHELYILSFWLTTICQRKIVIIYWHILFQSPIEQICSLKSIISCWPQVLYANTSSNNVDSVLFQQMLFELALIQLGFNVWDIMFLRSHDNTWYITWRTQLYKNDFDNHFNCRNFLLYVNRYMLNVMIDLPNWLPPHHLFQNNLQSVKQQGN